MLFERCAIFTEVIINEAPVLVMAVAAFVALFLLWLLLRPVKYWYWRVNKRDRLLEEMDKKLSDIRRAQAAHDDRARRGAESARRGESQAGMGTKPERGMPRTEAHDARCEAAQPIENDPRKVSAARCEAAQPAWNDPRESHRAQCEAGQRGGCEKPSEKAARTDEAPTKYTDLIDATDKRGRTYTREEIEEKIRF